MQLVNGPSVPALDLGCCRLLGHGDEGGLVEPLQDEVRGLRGDPTPELDSACVLEASFILSTDIQSSKLEAIECISVFLLVLYLS